MSNQLTITDANLVFDTISAMPVSQAIDTIEYIKTVAKKLKETATELEQYFGSDEPGGVVAGTNYELVTSQSSSESTSYDPNLIFDILKNTDQELAKDFLNIVKVTKTDISAFAKTNNLKMRLLEPALVTESKEPVLQYKIKLIK
jgi:hypothetical protein